ncbi:MAG TPA: hypothetical protein VGQ53_10205 [Chitinophagaceae bacterium]|jgi:hypothetical protein|nr:hypothetical protein [Chitinophagaceae bacterium]
MKKVNRFFSFGLGALCLTMNSCSQTASSKPTALISFEATTPCDDISRSLLNIPTTDKSVMMKWALTFLTPNSYKLIYTYGMDKANTRGFSEGAITKEQTGKWTKSKYKNTEIYTLTADNAPSLSFLKLNENVLHLLDAGKNLMVGNGAWSYTLNRINPVKLSSNEAISQKVEESDATDSIVFDGRMPCYAPLLALSGKTTTGCNLVKCRIIFFSDNKLHGPSSLKLYSVHVGTGGTRYLATGRWMITRGTKTDPNSTLYELQFDSEKKQQNLVLLKGDDNILFLLDSQMNYMAGNDYCSFTLNRVKK